MGNQNVGWFLPLEGGGVKGGSKISIPLSSKMVEDNSDSFGIIWLNHAYVHTYMYVMYTSWRG